MRVTEWGSMSSEVFVCGGDELEKCLVETDSRGKQLFCFHNVKQSVIVVRCRGALYRLVPSRGWGSRGFKMGWANHAVAHFEGHGVPGCCVLQSVMDGFGGVSMGHGKPVYPSANKSEYIFEMP